MKSVGSLGVLVCAMAWTAANAVKPLHIDDAAYYQFARQWASAPADPYGFDWFWSNRLEPARRSNVAPVLPAWWGLGIALFGDRPWAWKLWLFPFCWMCAWASRDFARRWCGEVATPVWLGIVVSPAIWPGLNLMLDVPALGLALAGFAIYLRAVEAKHRVGLLAAGVLVGLATQTKYSALVMPAVVVWHGAISGRFKQGMCVACGALALFLGWETAMATVYDQSIFLGAARGGIRHAGSSIAFILQSKLLLSGRLALLAGALFGPLAAFAFRANGRPSTATTVLALWASLIVLLAVLPMRAGLYAAAIVQSMTFVLLIVGIRRLVVRARQCADSTKRAELAFLTGWLLLEITGALLLSPFPAARRFVGITPPLLLLVVSTARQLLQRAPLRRSVTLAVAASMIYTQLLYFVDLIEAKAEAHSVRAAVAYIRERGNGPVWYAGHWGFQFEAQRRGWRPLEPGVTSLATADWVVVPDSRHAPLRLEMGTGQLVESVAICLGDFGARHTLATGAQPAESDALGRIPWRTVPSYYGWYRPLEGHTGPRVELRLYRVAKPGPIAAAPEWAATYP